MVIKLKKGNEQKSKNFIAMPRRKKAQEEMVGFALIIIVVAVVILIFLAFSIRSPEKDTIESYEVESFIQSMLQYTTECRDNLEALNVQKLIFECQEGSLCENGENSCDILESELNGISESSWPVGENRPVKGYSLNISSGGSIIVSLNSGEVTQNSKGSVQEFFKGGNLIEIIFKAYYLGTTILH